MAEACFTYGTLMFDDVFAAVTGLTRTPQMARLDGYARHPVRSQLYPGIRPDAGSQVDGRLYLDIPPDALARLDRFEGSDYVREAIEVTLDDGSRVRAWTYVFHPACYHRLAPGPWDVERFLASGKERFVHAFQRPR